MDKQDAPLSIGIFVSHRRLRAPLCTLLSIVGYRITLYGKQNCSLTAFLEELLERLQQTETPPYDLLILETAVTELVGHSYSCLAHLASMHTLPIIVLTDTSAPELSLINVITVPVGKVLQPQQEQYQALVKIEQARSDRHREWAEQKQEWLNQQCLLLRQEQLA